MKRFVIIMAALCLVAASVSAQDVDLKGKMLLSAYGGYAFGMGDVFDKVETTHYTMENKAEYLFGASFHYGLMPKVMLGVDFHMQSYKYQTTLKAGAPAALAGTAMDESEMEYAVLASGLYALMMNDKQAFFLNAGGGAYAFGSGDAGSTEFGGFVGGMFRYMVTPKIGLYLQPRVHFVFADDMFEIIQVAGGIQIPLPMAE